MTERSASQTAQGVAFMRAAHQILDSRPLILDDPVAARLIGANGVAAIEANPARFQTDGARALRAHVVLRSRFAEDRLAAAVERGVTQCVVLGAGLDTFAFRQPAWAGALRVFEVDHAASQEQKRSLLSATAVTIPDNVVFADVDFERESLRDALTRHGVSFDTQTFFSWLGVTMYLTQDAIGAVLSTIAGFPPGSEVVLTFAPPRELDENGEVRPSLADRAAELGEPWRSYFDAASMEHTLRAAGFATVVFLTPPESHERYFAGRADGLPAPRRTTIVSAIV